MSQQEKIQEALSELEAAFVKLNDLWLDAEEDQDERLSKNYPFEKDFNELTADVKIWAKK